MNETLPNHKLFLDYSAVIIGSLLTQSSFTKEFVINCFDFPTRKEVCETRQMRFEARCSSTQILACLLTVDLEWEDTLCLSPHA